MVLGQMEVFVMITMCLELLKISVNSYKVMAKIITCMLIPKLAKRHDFVYKPSGNYPWSIQAAELWLLIPLPSLCVP